MCYVKDDEFTENGARNKVENNNSLSEYTVQKSPVIEEKHIKI